MKHVKDLLSPDGWLGPGVFVLMIAVAILIMSFAGSASATETSGTLSVCVNDYTGNIVARADCGANETHYLVEAEEVVVPASPRPTPTEVEATR